MKAKSLISAVGLRAAAAVVVGMLGALSSDASNALTKTAYSAPAAQAAPGTCVCTEGASKKAEVQVAVMAKAPVQGAKRAVFVRR
jgi:hypothetical protein